MIDWRTMSDYEIDAALAERERRAREVPSPFPWVAHTFSVVDAQGQQVCHFGGTQGNNPDKAVTNARLCSVGPDGLGIAQLIVDLPESEIQYSSILAIKARDLIKKATGTTK